MYFPATFIQAHDSDPTRRNETTRIEIDVAAAVRPRPSVHPSSSAAPVAIPVAAAAIAVPVAVTVAARPPAVLVASLVPLAAITVAVTTLVL